MAAVRRSRLPGPAGRVFGLGWRPAGDADDRAVLASVSEDGSLTVWDAPRDERGPPARKHLAKGVHKDEALRCCWAPSGACLATGGALGDVNLHRWREDEAPAAITGTTALPRFGEEGEDAQVYGLCFVAEERIVVGAGTRVACCNLHTTRCEWSAHFAPQSHGEAFVYGGLRNEDAAVFVFDVAVDSGLMAVAASDGSVHVFDVRARQACAHVTRLPLAQDDCVTSCAFKDGRIASTTGSGKGVVWDLRNASQPTVELEPHGGPAYSCVFLANGVVATTGVDKVVQLHNTATRAVRRLKLTDRGLSCAAQHGILAVAGGGGGLVRDTSIHLFHDVDDAALYATAAGPEEAPAAK